MAPLVTGLAGLYLMASPLTTVAGPSDTQITRTIESDLAGYAGVSAHLMDVTTSNGVVKLSGIVDHLLARDQAVALTKSIKGVRAVVDQLEVRPVLRTDSQVRGEVEAAIDADPATERGDVQVSVSNGKVTLEGDVESWQERMLAEQVAKGVRGVRDVTNLITYTPVNGRADAEIADDIQQRMKMDARIDNLMLTVDVKDGVVQLSGFVASDSEKTLAKNLAWVEGVTDVQADLLLVSYDKTKEEAALRKTLPNYSDTEIQKAVIAALAMDPRVKDANIDVEVEYGSAALHGTVSSFAGRLAADQTARNTVGIAHVENHLKVRPERWVEDKKLHQQVTAALDRNPYLNPQDIKVEVVNNKAYLRGTVDNTFKIQEAYRTVSKVDGVVDIDNGLLATTTPLKSESLDHAWYHYIPDAYYPAPQMPSSLDAEIRDNVESELFWSPFIDSDRINVEVHDGSVVLTGFVDDYGERRIATENAWEGGAQGVRNHLKVR